MHDNWIVELGWSEEDKKRHDAISPASEFLKYRPPNVPSYAGLLMNVKPIAPLRNDNKFFALARLELASRFPEREPELYDWKNAGLTKNKYWQKILDDDLLGLDLLGNNSDFGLNVLLRLVYLYGALPEDMSAPWLNARRMQWNGTKWVVPVAPNFDARAQERIQNALLRYKYWHDESFYAMDEEYLQWARRNKNLEDKKRNNKPIEDKDTDLNDPQYQYEMEYWSENHQILFATAEYLAGQLLPKEIFRPGERYRSKDPKGYRDMNGQERMKHAKERLDIWLDDRLRFGWSEWNGPGYYDEHFIALLNLADFALDNSLQTRACMALDLLVFDLARFTHDGSFSVAAGRAHFKHKNCGWQQSPGDLVEILFGTRKGVFATSEGLSACAFASSRRYTVPNALLEIGRDKPTQMIDRTRVSIDFAEAGEYGIGFEKEQDVMRWWSRAAWITKHVINATYKLVGKYHLGKTGIFKDVLPLLGNPLSQTVKLADALSIFTEGSAYTRANLYTYRNRDAMLSSAQNHHAGQLSFQGNTCQATLSMGATVFTSHPSAGGGIDGSTLGMLASLLGPAGKVVSFMSLESEVFSELSGKDLHLLPDLHFLPPSDDGPDWWTGTVTQPRVLQMKNAAILAYKPNAFQLLFFGQRFHAYFPQNAFNDLPDRIRGKPPISPDECKTRSENYFPLRESQNCNVSTGRWIFGRAGDGYIGLFSGQMPEWTHDGDWACREIMVHADRNIFIIQIGNKQEFGSYEQFVDRVLRARIHINGLNWKLSDFQCSYDIPGGSRLSLDYDNNKVSYAGMPISDDNFPRIENQYAQIEWLQNKYVIQHAGYSLTHDVKRRQRVTGGMLQDLAHEVNLRFYAQNMGLFYIVAPYGGTERDKALQKLIDVLRTEKFDVVGLSEMWHAGDRDRILNELGDIYKYSLDGPRVVGGVAGAVVGAAVGVAVLGPAGAVGGAIVGAVAAEETDATEVTKTGGLFLLSRHKIVASNAMVYQQYECVGEDLLANKGALHARIQVQGVPFALDVFLSHTQSLSPNVGKKADAEDALKAQLRHLAVFVQSCRDYRYPALLMGDLNVDSSLENDLHKVMGMTDEDMVKKGDLNKFYPDAKTGDKNFINSPIVPFVPLHPDATSEDDTDSDKKKHISSFGKGTDPRGVESTERFGAKAGRLDYFLSWDGTIFTPTYTDRKVVIHQSSEGRDMSDHYGIQTRLATINQKLPSPSQKIKSVSVKLTKFWCFKTTSGYGDDEVEFTLHGVAANGKQQSVTTKRFEKVSEGTQEIIETNPLQYSDPGEFLLLAVSGKEIDTLSADDDLGTGSVRLMRHELQSLVKKDGTRTTTQRVLPRLTGDGGEYAVEVEIVIQ